MNAFSARLSAAGFAAALALGTALTASAAPLVPTPDTLAAVSWPKIIQVEGADASQAQAGGAPYTDRRGRQTYESERLQRASPAQERGYDRRSDSRSDRDRSFYRSGNNAYYNGHRGYRYRRDGYREYNGYWFPLAAFAAGAVIAGALAAPLPPVVAVAPSPHVDWCARTYRSYNPYDNSFQPFRGPRQYCVSPWS